MSDVTRLLDRIDAGDPHAADELLPIVYDQLRRLAHQRLAHESPGQSLQTADLVHEAYLRLLGTNEKWQGEGHFFVAAAEAMRRILVEKARRKQRHKHGGGRKHVEWSEDLLPLESDDTEVLAVHEALDHFAQHDAEAAELVKLHFFAGITIDDAAALLGISPRSAYRNWAYARAWLFRHFEGGAESQSGPDPH